MSESDEIKLWCWVLGDPRNRIFRVSIKRSAAIDDLKAAIHVRKPSFKDFAVDSLCVFKFQLPLRNFNEDSAQSIKLEDGQLLEPEMEISSYWMEDPGKILSVILPRPAATITPSSSQNSNLASFTGERPPGQKLFSEHPLHKLWMLAREPQSTLFQTRPVQRDKSCPSTETNLPLGGDWVQELQPGSGFTGVLIRDEYLRALRAIVKWFLANEMTEPEDAMEGDDIEPLPAPLAFDVPLGVVSENRGFILLGDPGIATSSISEGKTVLLYVLLVLRLQAQLPTIYQSRASHLYHFADDGVYLINLTPSSIATNFKSQFHKSTWCLIDSNQSLDTVPVFIQDLDLFIVQASSPRPHRWIDKATGPVFQYFMKSWTFPELLVGYVTYLLISEPFVIPLSRVLQRKVCSEAQIEFFSTRYGTSARSVYINASCPLEYETSLLQKMAKITHEEMAKLFREAYLGGAVSHQLVTISPGATRNAFHSTFPTRYVYEKFRDSLSDHKLEAAARLYDIFIRNQNTKVPASFMLEDAVNDVFFRGGEWSLVPMMKSNCTGPKYTHQWKNPNGSITPQYLHLGYLGHHIAIDTTPHPVGTVYVALPHKCFLPGGSLQLVDGYYYPSSRFQETFDPFIYESASKTATVFQVTTAKTHSVKEGGVKWLQDLGVERFRYIAVSTPNTPLDLPFPNEWNASPGPSIPE
ncbi:hypothetical protein F5887DRAFT_1159528, partial [Amanita rubescens]